MTWTKRIARLRRLIGRDLGLSKPVTLEYLANMLERNVSTVHYWTQGRGISEKNQLGLIKLEEKYIKPKEKKDV